VRFVIASVLVFFSISLEAAYFSFTGSVTTIDDSLGLFQDAVVGDDISGYFQYSTEPSDWDYENQSGDYYNYQESNPDTNVWDLGGISSHEYINNY